MLVVPIAWTALSMLGVDKTGYQESGEYPPPFNLDELAEVAGRVCYQSWDRPRPETATNNGYLKNILKQGHFSVLEHSSVSFYVEGVSRSLLTELERHRFLSFSVISQRFVRYDKQPSVVIPPLIEENKEKPLHDPDRSEYGWTIGDEFQASSESAFDSYYYISRRFEEIGYPKKQALEAARSVLPNATEVKMVVTGNLRCWRDVIGKRYHVAADAEIREFSTEVLKQLREIAPNSVQDIPEQPYE